MRKTIACILILIIITTATGSCFADSRVDYATPLTDVFYNALTEDGVTMHGTAMNRALMTVALFLDLTEIDDDIFSDYYEGLEDAYVGLISDVKDNPIYVIVAVNERGTKNIMLTYIPNYSLLSKRGSYTENTGWIFPEAFVSSTCERYWALDSDSISDASELIFTLLSQLS